MEGDGSSYSGNDVDGVIEIGDVVGIWAMMSVWEVL
jgi:hypothetical protein